MPHAFTADFCRKHVFLGDREEPLYGDDQMNMTYPVRFPTVSLELASTDALTELADSIREEQGYLPLLPTEKHPEDYDPDGWYNFYVELNTVSPTKISPSIEYVVCSETAEDDGCCGWIALDTMEQAALYSRLNDLCVEEYGKTCAELLAESQQELDELVEYERSVGK